MMKKIIVFAASILILFSCMVVRPGQVGYIQNTGKLSENPVKGGSHLFNPFTSKMVKINTQIVEVYERMIVPSKEGLSVDSEISLLYHVNPDRAKEVYIQFGSNYQEVVIISNLRATTREICARYEAKELYSTQREKIENAIKDQLTKQISQYGFIIDAVLLRDIIMPKEIILAIERKVEAEQNALTMEFIIDKQKKEAERQIIEAEGIKKSQEIINTAINQEALQYRYIEALKAIGTSPNAKTILMDKQAPVFITE